MAWFTPLEDIEKQLFSNESDKSLLSGPRSRYLNTSIEGLLNPQSRDDFCKKIIQKCQGMDLGINRINVIATTLLNSIPTRIPKQNYI